MAEYPNQFGLWLILDLFADTNDEYIQQLLLDISKNHTKYVKPHDGPSLNDELIKARSVDPSKNINEFALLKNTIGNNLKGEDILTLITKMLEVINNRLKPE